jgi:hypothetical protein
MDETTQRRIGRNEALFRVVNEQIAELLPGSVGTFEIVCECGDPGCLKVISVSTEAYEGVRADPRRFIVRAEHQIPEVETVVEVVDGVPPFGTYFVVQKKEGVASQAAEARDPRD